MAIRGEIEFPGDKSISHRALMLASLAFDQSRIKNLSTGNDIQSTRKCLEACGINIKNDKNEIIVEGNTFSNPIGPLYCGNSGTTARLMFGLLAGRGIQATFTGDESLSSRPMDRIMIPLSKMGLKYKSTNGKLPVSIEHSNLNGIEYESVIASAQLKSAIILAGLGANNETVIIEPLQSRDHTEIMLTSMGANIQTDGLSTSVEPLCSELRSIDITVPGDPSTASFFVAAASLIPDSNIIIKNILLNPTRGRFFSVIKEMGGNIQCIDRFEQAGEAIGNLAISYQELSSITINGQDVPALIDELPILAILATQAKGTTIVNGAGELRVKECDRIKAICLNLKKMGGDILELEDGFIINGPTKLHGAKIETFYDHRIAMAFTIAGLITESEVILDHPECASTSFPEFYSVLERVHQ
tara:strand:+ start:4838 stop:6085 length:1248 start_codon:yes stop_codon:yes gene_type:complete